MNNLIVEREINDLLNKVSKITKTNYTDYSMESLIYAIEELLYECEFLNDEIQEIKNDMQDNYKPISKSEEIYFNEKDFL